MRKADVAVEAAAEVEATAQAKTQRGRKPFFPHGAAGGCGLGRVKFYIEEFGATFAALGAEKRAERKKCVKAGCWGKIAD